MSEADVKLLINRGFNTNDLMQKLKLFYHEERVSLIRIVRYVFCDNTEEYSILGEMILGISQSKTKLELFDKILGNYRDFLDDAMKTKTQFGNCSDEASVMRLLEEEVEMLETLLLGACVIKTTRNKNLFTRVLDVFKVTNFASDLSIGKYAMNKPSCKILTERICMLQSLIITELAGIDLLFVDTSELQNHFLNDTTTLRSLLTNARRLSGTRPSQTILMMLTSLLHMTLPVATTASSQQDRSAATLASNLGENALTKLDMLPYLRSVIAPGQRYCVSDTEGSHIGLAVLGELYGLLCLLSQAVSLHGLAAPLRQQLTALARDVVTPVMRHCPDHSLNRGLHRLLDDLSTSFPADLGLLQMLGCVMEGPEAVSAVTQFVESLSWFAGDEDSTANMQPLETGEPDEAVCDGVVPKCVLTAPYQPYGPDSDVVLAEGTSGVVLHGRPVWAVHYSVWTVLKAEVQRDLLVLSNPGSTALLQGGNNDGLTEMMNRLTISASFIAACVETGVSSDAVLTMVPEFLPLLESTCLLQMSCYGGESMLAAVLRLCVALLVSSPSSDATHAVLMVELAFPRASFVQDRAHTSFSLLSEVWSAQMSAGAADIVLYYLHFSGELVRYHKKAAHADSSDSTEVPQALLCGSLLFVTLTVLPSIGQVQFERCADAMAIMEAALTLMSEVVGSNVRLLEGDSRLALMRQLVHDQLVHEAPQRCLLSVSCGGQQIRQQQPHGLPGQLMLAMHGLEDRTARCTRLAITLLDHVLVDGQSGAAIALLQTLDCGKPNNSQASLRGGSRTSRQLQWTVQCWLDLVTGTCSPRLSRMAALLLRRLVESGSVSLAVCLLRVPPTAGELPTVVPAGDSRRSIDCIRDGLARIVCSFSVDQMLRCRVFELMAASVQIGCSTALTLLGRMDAPGWVEASCELLTHIDSQDDVSVYLARSVSRLLLAIWMKDCADAMAAFNKQDIWSGIKSTCSVMLEQAINSERLLADRETQLEVLCNLLGLLAMQTYLDQDNSSSSDSRSNTVASCLMLTTSEGGESGDQLGLLLLLQSDLLLSDSCLVPASMLQLLRQTLSWWKTMLYTVLRSEQSFATEAVCDLTRRVLAASCHLSTLSAQPIISDIQDLLCSCVLEIADSQRGRLSTSERMELARATTDALSRSVVEKRSGSQWRRQHVDLFAALTLLLDTVAAIEPCDREIETRAGVADCVYSYIQRLLSPRLATSACDPTFTKVLIAVLHASSLESSISLSARLITVAGNGECLMVSLVVLLQDYCQTSQGYQDPALQLLQLLLHCSTQSVACLTMLQTWPDLLPGLVALSDPDCLHTTLRLAASLLAEPATAAVSLRPALLLLREAWPLLHNMSATLAGPLLDLLQLLSPHRGLWLALWPASMLHELWTSLCRLVTDYDYSTATNSNKDGLALFISALQLYSKLTLIVSEDTLLQGCPYSGSLLSLDFSEPKPHLQEPGVISFGCIFSFLNNSVCHLKQTDQSQSLLTEAHELSCGLVVSHSLAHLSSGKLAPPHRAALLFGLRTELHSYLASLSRCRRRATPPRALLPANRRRRSGTAISVSSWSLDAIAAADNFFLAMDLFRRSVDSLA